MNEFYSYSFKDYSVYQTPNLWQTYQNYNYMIAHRGKAFVFDPGEFAPIHNCLLQNGLELAGIYLTHHHQDHTGATKKFKHQWNCPVYGFQKDRERLPELTNTFHENDIIEIAGLKAKILFLPGHTSGLCAFYIPDKNWLFSNDLIFSLGCGRIFEGTAKQMYDSLNTVFQLPDETLIFSSHEYTQSNLHFALSVFKEDKKLLNIKKEIQHKLDNSIPTVPTTLAFEKQHNPFLRWNDLEIRQTLNLEDAENWQVFARIRELKDNF